MARCALSTSSYVNIVTMMEQPRPMQIREFRQNEQRILITADADALSHAAADRIIEHANAAIADHGTFYLALSGGSTPRHLHQVLADPANRQRIPWDKVHIYFGDERNVPSEHPDSNYRMAMDTLLNKVPIPVSQVHAIPTGCDDMQDCADQYAELLTSVPQQSGRPCFDLILLGMGNDGHTASLFPQTAILQERERNVAAVFVSKLDSWRVSLTYPVLNQAKAIMVLVSGAAKADVLYEVFNEAMHNYPIQGIRNRNLEWYVDMAAAVRLIESDVGISG
jgi:6-phosphogluconolactonase